VGLKVSDRATVTPSAAVSDVTTPDVVAVS
jgi:hypothetical protein